MAKHDENKDLRLLSRIAKINTSNKTIQVAKTTPLGIRVLGRIDYLTHHCGWTLIYNNSIVAKSKNDSSDDKSTSKRELKKSKKEHPLTNKTRKLTKKKQHD